MKIGFLGLSHLGINYLAASAAKGFKVVGFDYNKNLINNLVSDKIHINEPNLLQKIKKYKKNICFTNEIKNFAGCKIIFISSDVPTNIKGKSNLKLIKKDINKLKKKFSNKNLVIMSQVMPGFTESLNWDKNKLFHQVETLIFGKAYMRAFKPERIILGVKNISNKINKDVLNFYKKFNCPIIKTNYKTSELIKISINLYLISTVTTTNVISSICEKIGADWQNISDALKLDKRIGKFAYLKPGLGISGGNLERDLFSITEVAKKNNLDTNLFKTWENNSINQKKWIYKIYNKFIKNPKNKKLGVLGLTYKENTNSLKNSPSINLIKKIKNVSFYAYDPSIKSTKFKHLILCKSIEEVINKTRVLFILTPWKNFKNINIKILTKNKISIVVDPFGMLTKYLNRFKQNKIKYFSLI